MSEQWLEARASESGTSSKPTTTQSSTSFLWSRFEAEVMDNLARNHHIRDRASGLGRRGYLPKIHMHVHT